MTIENVGPGGVRRSGGVRSTNAVNPIKDVAGVTKTGAAFNEQGEQFKSGVEKKWRGIGQGMSLAVQGFSGGTDIWSQTNSKGYTLQKSTITKDNFI